MLLSVIGYFALAHVGLGLIVLPAFEGPRRPVVLAINALYLIAAAIAFK